MGDRHRGAVEGDGQRAAQPFLAGQRHRAPAVGQHRFPAAQRGVLAEVVVGRADRLLVQLLLFQRVVAGGEGVEIGPQRGADEAHAVDDDRFAVEPHDAQPLAGGAQACVGFVEFEPVVLVVARHVEHRRIGRAQRRREAFEPEVGAAEARPFLVGADVAGQHDEVDAGRDPWLEGRITFEVEVGKQLDAHGLRSIAVQDANRQAASWRSSASVAAAGSSGR